MSIFIHDSAHVSNNAIIGENSKIWINSQVREGSKIGDNCIISKDTYIDTGVFIGNYVKIQNGVSVYSGVTIEDKVFIGPNVVFTNDYFPRACNTEWKITPTLVKEGASLGANSTIVCGIIIGTYSMVGAGSVVTKDVPPYALVVGNPAKKIGFVCECGQRLNADYVCNKCNKSYIFLKGV